MFKKTFKPYNPPFLKQKQIYGIPIGKVASIPMGRETRNFLMVKEKDERRVIYYVDERTIHAPIERKNIHRAEKERIRERSGRTGCNSFRKRKKIWDKVRDIFDRTKNVDKEYEEYLSKETYISHYGRDRCKYCRELFPLKELKYGLCRRCMIIRQ